MSIETYVSNIMAELEAATGFPGASIILWIVGGLLLLLWFSQGNQGGGGSSNLIGGCAAACLVGGVLIWKWVALMTFLGSIGL
jgi:hypothetical protein